jgi:hypothetical protein
VLDTDHLHRITAEVQGLAAAGVEGLDPEALCEVALTARRLRELVDHLEVHALGALEPTGHTESRTGLTAGAWFAREAKLPSSVGRAQITTARALRHLPETDQAWLDGRITRDHVRVLANAANPRIREQITALEAELIGITENRTFHHWRLQIGDVVARLDTEGRDPDDPTHTSATWGRSGLFAELRARFAGPEVELLEQLIEARTNWLYRTNVEEHNQTSDLPLLSRSQLRAQALIDLITHGHHTDLAPAPAPATEPDEDHHYESDGDLASDDVADDADDSDEPTAPTLFDPESPTSPTQKDDKRKRKKTEKNPLRVGVNLVLRAEARAPNPDLAALPGSDRTWTLTNPDGLDLALDRFASLICDADIAALLVDANDNPLNLGRDKRFATPEQRRTVIARDGGCVMPGCDCPSAWVEIHHVKLYSQGGTTDTYLLAALCRRHHGITHRKDWTMHATTDGWFWWTTPSGDTFWSQRYGRQRTGPTPPRSADIAAA